MHRLRRDAREPVLLVALELSGGVKRHVEMRQSQLSAAGHTVIILQPSGTEGRVNQVILSTQDRDLKNLAFNLPEETPVLSELLSGLRLSNIELHHFVGLPVAALELAASLGIRYDVYVHDYSWVCPRVTLIGGNGAYCGEPPVDACEACIRDHGTSLQKSLTVAALRTRSARILDGASAVIVPSEDVRTRLTRYFPSLPMKVTGWETPIEPALPSKRALDGRIRVAVIGAISIQKGYKILLECARDAAERNLDLDFVVIGFTCDDESLLATGRVFICGPYAENEAETLLEREQCDISLFPSVTPETWCYALSHAIRRSLPIVAFDMGAIAERLSAYAAAELLPLLTTPAGINDSLLRLVREVNSDSQKELTMSDTKPVPEELEASAKLLTLPVGVYAFGIQEGASAAPAEELAVPALQVGPAPMLSPGTVEFLASSGTFDRWLARGSDSIMVRISGGSVSLLLTSLHSPSSAALAINVRRLDTPELPAGEAGAGVLEPHILAHIRNFGDIRFDGGWAGFMGENLWIEAFAILSAGPLGPDAMEYRGITANGFETPWLSNQILCGSRGRGLPIMGFAIRLKPDVAERYDCAYTGKFVSGSTVGPLKDGELCCSEVEGDPLDGIALCVTARSV